MSAYKTSQRRVMHGGREYHFVSYEGLPANPRRGSPATEAAWFLMSAGKRWPVMPEVANLSEMELDLRLHAWLDAHVGHQAGGQSRSSASTMRR